MDIHPKIQYIADSVLLNMCCWAIPPDNADLHSSAEHQGIHHYQNPDHTLLHYQHI